VHRSITKTFALCLSMNENQLIDWFDLSISNPEMYFSTRVKVTGKIRSKSNGPSMRYFRSKGQASWGIAWYINDLLIPEIYVERGQTYTFIVQGGAPSTLYRVVFSFTEFFFRFAGRTGNDPTNSARYHPLYITDSSEGGFGQKTENEQRQQNVYAGVAYDSKQFPYPTSGESTTSTRTQSKSNPPIVSSKISHWKMGLCSPLRSTGVQEWPLIEGYRFFWLPASISFSFNSWTFVRVDGQDDGQMGRIGHI